MQAVVTTLVNIANAIFNFFRAAYNTLADWLLALWNAWLFTFDLFVSFLVKAILVGARVAVDFTFFVLTAAAGLLPSMPEGGSTNFSGFGMLAQANVYVPLSEIVALTAIWGAVFGAIGVYKLSKFVRGGG